MRKNQQGQELDRKIKQDREKTKNRSLRKNQQGQELDTKINFNLKGIPC